MMHEAISYHRNTVLSNLYITDKAAMLPVLSYMFCVRTGSVAEVWHYEGELFSN